MGERDERGMELRGRQEDAPGAHGVEEAAVSRGVRPLRGGVIGHRLVGEEARQHRPDAVDGERDASLARRGDEPALELGAQAVEPPIDVPFPECAERREPGGDGQRVPRERAGLVDGAEWRDSAHEVAAPPIRADGQAAADDLAETREIRTYAVLHLSAAEREAEARDDLVDTPHRAVARAES